MKTLEKIDSNTTLIARKLTSMEYRMMATGETVEEIVRSTADSDRDGQSIIASHFRQMEDLDVLLKASSVDLEQVVAGTKLSRRMVKPYKRVVSFGGDDFEKYVGYFLERQILIGYNSDFEGSNGALTRYNRTNIDELIPRLEDGRFRVEEWPRLAASVDGRELRPKAVSEIFLGIRDRLKTSKYYFDSDDIHVRMANSGLILATGAGSTGWIKTASSCVHQEAESFDPTEAKARFFGTEAIFNRIYEPSQRDGFIVPGQSIEAAYSGHLPGIISFDSVNNFRISRGQTARLWIADQPLQVATTS